MGGRVRAAIGRQGRPKIDARQPPAEIDSRFDEDVIIRRMVNRVAFGRSRSAQPRRNA
jgi:hypothetical protein